MNENVRGQEELSIGDIFKILLRKIKILFLVLLAGMVVGASLGVLTTFNVKYYGTAVEFYVNPKLDSAQIGAESQYGVYGTYTRPVMDNMVRLLASDSFSEQLLLDEDGMPKFRNDENKAAIDAAISEARPKIETWKQAKVNAKKAGENTVKAQVAFNEKVSEWNMKKQMSDDGETVKDEDGNVISSKEFFEAVQTALENAKLAEKEAGILVVHCRLLRL